MAVGRGIKSQENIALAEKLAAALGAELAASRPICDAGWLPMERQIGSSGQTVAPKLYVAVGISGAIQHVVGMKGARTIVAINKDADAPDLRGRRLRHRRRPVRGAAGPHEGARAVATVVHGPRNARRRRPDRRRRSGRAVGGAAAGAAAEGTRRRAAGDCGAREGARGRRPHAVGRRARSVGAARAGPRLRREGRAARVGGARRPRLLSRRRLAASRCRSRRRRCAITATTSSR